MSRFRAIIFDLDGTLVQTRESSWILFERTNRAFNLGIDAREQYFDLFHDNIFEALQRRIGDDAKWQEVLDHFLDLLRREYEPLVVPGMMDVVRMLASDYVLSIVSSNAVSVIGRIVESAGVTNCIAHIFGGDVVPDKRAAIRAILADPSYATLREDQPAYQEQHPTALQPNEVVLVTDTVGDIRHAKECGIGTIAVSWGLHRREDLLMEEPDILVNWPLEIVSYVRGEALPASSYFSDGARFSRLSK